jgi:hypothetical protein
MADHESLRAADEEDERINVSEYQQGIGSLLYAIVFTRPDIGFVLGKLSQFMSDPAKHHGHALKNLLRYVKSTINLKQKLRFGPGGAYDHRLSTRTQIGQAINQIERPSLAVLLCSTEVQSHGQARSKTQYQHQAVNRSMLLSQHALNQVNGLPNCFGT